VEVASASTRGHDLLRKRDVYERYGVSEYWFVDLEAQRVEVFRLRGDDRRRYGDPQLVSRNQSYETNLLPSFTLDVGQILPESTS
jgi:Uma2 family endonuclease